MELKTPLVDGMLRFDEATFWGTGGAAAPAPTAGLKWVGAPPCPRLLCKPSSVSDICQSSSMGTRRKRLSLAVHALLSSNNR